MNKGYNDPDELRALIEIWKAARADLAYDGWAEQYRQQQLAEFIARLAELDGASSLQASVAPQTPR